MAVSAIFDDDHRFAILTLYANASMIETHDRMRIIIGRDVHPANDKDWWYGHERKQDGKMVMPHSPPTLPS